ncbi:phage repressor protein [Macrococcoides caseolyticum]|uniref:BRO family protein n=1 Tax=Macrococcoides caseolyticum TaxID=69966 RepID=UPI000C34BCC2|nr:BRO family protein [Macrococcus caseolyticus]PKE07417.1 phage repressor protein [Macrococcus caseolyticus]PKE34663.1 phage repressor protein [Macrococcus caseolyticus]PKE54200.1 phage repressor protein [Macrococcus caseolyticus]PKE63922.1 phage repressor protein [Macrococcus caseolyticus]PKF39283.1 phage repressor protein [Macrococcus caseolyticus]
MNSLQVFNFERLPVRTLEIDGEPYFVGKDVAEILGYADPSSAVSKKVDSEDKTTLPFQQPGSNYQTNVTFINESGLYALIFSSKLESAKRFKRWITSEVLPTLRKTGSYHVKPLTTQEQIQLIAKGNNELVERVEAIETSIPVFPGESKHIHQTVKRKATEVMKNQFNGIPISKISRKVYSALYRSLYTAFNVPNYQSIPRGKYQDAIRFIETWQLQSEVAYQIKTDLRGEVHGY